MLGSACPCILFTDITNSASITVIQEWIAHTHNMQ